MSAPAAIFNSLRRKVEHWACAKRVPRVTSLHSRLLQCWIRCSRREHFPSTEFSIPFQHVRSEACGSRSATVRRARPCECPRARQAAYLARLAESRWIAVLAQWYRACCIVNARNPARFGRCRITGWRENTAHRSFTVPCPAPVRSAIGSAVFAKMQNGASYSSRSTRTSFAPLRRRQKEHLSMEAATQETQCIGAHQCPGRSRLLVRAQLYART